MTYYELDQLHTDAIRLDAVQWLRKNIGYFPKSMDMDISNRIYKNFRFIRYLDGEIVFGNCIVPGITEQDFINL